MSKENENKEIINFPKLVGWYDIVVGVGQVALHFVTDQFRHEGVSEHFITDAVDAEPYAQFDLWHDMGGDDA